VSPSNRAAITEVGCIELVPGVQPQWPKTNGILAWHWQSSRASEQNEHKMGVEMLGFEMIRGQDADAGTQLVVCTLDGFRQRTLGLLLQKVAVLAASTRMCSN
jgi:hypothetical protein